MGCIRQKKKILVHQQGATCAEIGKCDSKPMSMWLHYISYVIKLRTQLSRSLRLLCLDKGAAYTKKGGGYRLGSAVEQFEIK